jgi:hypothetical protein
MEKPIMNTHVPLQHPDANTPGANVNQARRDVIQAAILDTLRRHEKLTYEDLARFVEQKLSGKFDGSIRWYVTTVKLDLEARHVIERVKDKRREFVRLAR